MNSRTLDEAVGCIGGSSQHGTDVVAKVPTSLGFNGNTEASIATVTTHTIAGTLALTQAQLQHATVDIGASNHEVGCGYGVEAVT